MVAFYSENVSQKIKEILDGLGERVKAGAELLDEQYPNWYQKDSLIDERTGVHPGHKILEELFTRNCDGKKVLAEALGQKGCEQTIGITYGFELKPVEHGLSIDYRRAWEEQIVLRRLEDEKRAREIQEKI